MLKWGSISWLAGPGDGDICRLGGETHPATALLPFSPVLPLLAVKNYRRGCPCYLYSRHILNPHVLICWILAKPRWLFRQLSLGAAQTSAKLMGKFWWISKGYGSNGFLSQGWMQKRAFDFFVQYTAMCRACRMCWSPSKFLGSTKAARQLLKCQVLTDSSLEWYCLWNKPGFFPSLGCEKRQQAIKILLGKTWCQSIILI